MVVGSFLFKMFSTSTQQKCWMFRDEHEIHNCRLAANVKYISSRGKLMSVDDLSELDKIW